MRWAFGGISDGGAASLRGLGGRTAWRRSLLVAASVPDSLPVVWVSSSCGCGWEGGGGLQAFLDGFAHGWRDPLVARVGGGAGFAGRWWCGQVVGSTATVKGNCESQEPEERLRRRLRGERPGSGEWGSRWLPPDVACGRLRPGFPVASSPYGSRPVRWYQVGSPSWWSSISDLTPPDRPAWLRPPKRRGIRDKPTCGKSSRASCTHRLAAAVPREVDRVHTTGGGCPGFPVASAVLAQPSRPGRCPAGRNRWPATVIRLDTAQAGMVPSGRRSDGESGTQATTSNNRRLAARPPLPGARPLAAQAPPEAPLTLTAAFALDCRFCS
ncbi:hypothetical protein ABIA35_005317 [Catenulispora sp. MAP12-49]